MTHASNPIVRWSVLAAVVAAMTACAADSSEHGQEGSAREFIALAGTSAADFEMPLDMRLEVSQYIPARGLTYERYQQMYGEATVMGGQINVYRDDAGQVTLVIGAHFDDLNPVNSLVLSSRDAVEIALADLRKQGIMGELETSKCRSCTVEMDTEPELCPDSARIFYTVVTLSDNFRHLHWINAQTGAIIEEFDTETTANALRLPSTLGQRAMTHQWESGSLSESFSALTTAGAWSSMDPSWFSADITSFAGAEMPFVAGPDHYCDRHTAATDNWGVNINAGIPSRAFISAANAGSYNDAAAAFFDGFNFLPSTATFMDARDATIAAAQAQFSADSSEVAAIVAAWDDVGVVHGATCGLL